MKSKKFYLAKAAVLFSIPVTLLALPANFFDNGRDICLFTVLSGYNCWGCGLTRACMHLIHLEGARALEYNKLSYIVLPILSGLLLQDFLKTVNKYDERILRFIGCRSFLK